MSKSLHWTQKPENRDKVIAIQKLAAAARVRNAAAKKKTPKAPHRSTIYRRNLRHAGKRHTAAARKKIGDAMRAAAAQRKAAAQLNGHAVSGMAGFDLPQITGKRLAKAAVTQLALDGARYKLIALEQACDVLRIFLKQAAR